MAYQPVLNNVGPRIVFEGMQEQNRTKRAEQAMLQEGLERAGQAVAQMGQQWKQQKLQRDVNDAKVQAFLSVAQQDPDLVGGMEFVNKMVGEKNQDKLSVHLAMAEGMFQQGQKQRMMEREYELRAGMDAAANSRVGQTFSVPNPQTGQMETYIWTNRGQVAPMGSGSSGGVPDADPVPQYDQDKNLIGHIITVNGKQQFSKHVPPRASIFGDDPQAMKARQEGELQSQIADLEAKVAGGNKHRGPDWLPIFGSYEKELEAKRAALSNLQGGKGVAVTSDAVQGFQSAEDVKAALRAGKLSREQAVEVLRNQFGL